jgi:hypothetical protein
MNLLPRFYHHGDTQDLSHILDYALAGNQYEQVVLIGYSMGGSMLTKYLGERETDDRILGGIGFSVPCNLKDSADQLEKKENKVYRERFLKKLKSKIRIKAEQHPQRIFSEVLDNIENFDEFHQHFTVPLHGFKNIDDFYTSSTCDQYFDTLRKPVLIANAWNDPLLGEKCYPRHKADVHPQLFLNIPDKGGHVGFTYWKKPYSWMEEKAHNFINEVLL